MSARNVICSFGGGEGGGGVGSCDVSICIINGNKMVKTRNSKLSLKAYISANILWRCLRHTSKWGGGGGGGRVGSCDVSHCKIKKKQLDAKTSLYIRIIPGLRRISIYT